MEKFLVQKYQQRKEGSLDKVQNFFVQKGKMDFLEWENGNVFAIEMPQNRNILKVEEQKILKVEEQKILKKDFLAVL